MPAQVPGRHVAAGDRGGAGEPGPFGVAVRVWKVGAKMALTDLAAVIVSVHSRVDLPGHVAGPHFLKWLSGLGVAVRVIVAPSLYSASQVAPLPQSIGVNSAPGEPVTAPGLRCVTALSFCLGNGGEFGFDRFGGAHSTSASAGARQQLGATPAGEGGTFSGVGAEGNLGALVIFFGACFSAVAAVDRGEFGSGRGAGKGTDRCLRR